VAKLFQGRNFMSGRPQLVAVLVMSVLGSGVAWGQPQLPTPKPYEGEVMPAPRVPDGPPQPPPTYLHEAQPVSPWITNEKNCCWGALAGAPIMSELYGVTGVSVPLGGEVGRQLGTGWIIGGGARLMLFDRPLTGAWTIDASITNTANHAIDPKVTTLNIIQPVDVFGTPQPTRMNLAVTLRDLNRTTLNLALGRELYIWGTALSHGNQWRVGWDIGGRYGGEVATFNEIRHRTDVIAGGFFTMHSDWEFPWSCCTLVCGSRLQWGYTFSNILQAPSDVADMNIMVTVGLRF
jgi:hypothetical protein